MWKNFTPWQQISIVLTALAILFFLALQTDWAKTYFG